VKVGEALGAEKLVRIKHAHVSGISYTNIGEHGLGFIRGFYEKRVYTRVYATLNPGCIDLTGSSKLISDRYRDKQLELNKYLELMGFKPTYTCIPYLHRRPFVDEHLAWGESSAVIYANSVFGARTNREGGPLAFAAALTGYTYYYGLHDLGERRVEVVVRVEDVEPGYYGAVGLWIGENIHEIPMINDIVYDPSNIKLLLAAAAASGSHALIVLRDITPPKTYIVEERVERVSIGKRDLVKYIEGLDSVSGDILGYIGCPHLDPIEFKILYDRIVSRGRRLRYKLLLSVPAIYARVFSEEISVLKRYGVDVAVGTCPIVSILNDDYDYIVTNSGKASFYMKRLHRVETIVAPIERILEIVSGDR
jgi:predicted aconitase